jgi:hypothetical protein
MATTTLIFKRTNFSSYSSFLIHFPLVFDIRFWWLQKRRLLVCYRVLSLSNKHLHMLRSLSALFDRLSVG